jgi:alkyl hydroperoxide reductase subunit AhpC
MTLRLGDTAPDFTAQTTQGDIRFYDWAGESWIVFFSHPADFTPVCTTELGTVARYRNSFDQRNVKTIAISVDSISSHLEWLQDINETQHTSVDYPIIADPQREIAALYDMIHPNASDTLTVRSVFIIDPAKKIRLILTYPAATGRNFDEIIRVIDSLQLTSEYKVATPANWKHGDDVIVTAAIKTEDLAATFPKGHTIIKPYLRTTPQPNT